MSTTSQRPNPDHGAAIDPFRQIAEAAPFGVVHTTAAGVALFVNQAWRDITGITTPAPIPYEVITELVHPDERGRVVGLYLAAAETLEPFETEVRLIRPDGETRHVRITGHPHLVDGELDGFTGTSIDVTDKVRAEAARDRSESRYHKLMARAPVGQAVYSLDLHLVEINEAAAALVGATPAELLGNGPTTCSPSRTRPAWSPRWPSSGPAASPPSRSSTSSRARRSSDLGVEHGDRRTR